MSQVIRLSVKRQKNFPCTNRATVSSNAFEHLTCFMKENIGILARTSLIAMLLGNAALLAQTTNPPAPIFPDKNLEAAVRKFVFEKRDNDKPLVEADLVSLSTIQAVGLGITNLAGLEKCQSL